jgi:hypothetical protein
VRSAESNRERDEVEHLAGSGRLPKGPCCHLRRFVSGLDSVKKERAAASMFKRRAPHRSSCSRHAQQRRRPSTEIRLDLNSAPQTHEPLPACFVPRAWRANGRDPPRIYRMQRYKPHSRLTRLAFSDKGAEGGQNHTLLRPVGLLSVGYGGSHLCSGGKDAHPQGEPHPRSSHQTVLVKSSEVSGRTV